MTAARRLDGLEGEARQLPADLEPFAGKYVAERVIGQGGMGTVFEARHIRLGQRVAIKVLGHSLLAYPELVTRFEREARAASALSSPHAVRIFDIDQTSDGTPFIVMEALEGHDLSRILEALGAQPVGRAVTWIVEACHAIAEAHSLGIVHRDLKPSNLFLADGPSGPIVKVLDFGIAKHVSAHDSALTQGLAPLGTPQYMSPEQVRCARDVDARTDVWSLGITLYELVTGATPFNHAEPSACIAAIAADPVPDPRGLEPGLPADFVAVLMRALAKSPDERFPSVEAFARALAPFAATDPTPDVGIRAATERTVAGEPMLGEPHGRDGAVRVGDDSAPLAVIRDRSTPEPVRRRRHSVLAIAAGAAAVATLLVVTTLRFAASASPPPTSEHAPVARTVAAANPTPLAPVTTAALRAAPARAVGAPAAIADASAPAVLADDAKPVVLAKPLRNLVAKPAPRSAEPPPRRLTADLMVHGGLSGPGF